MFKICNPIGHKHYIISDRMESQNTSLNYTEMGLLNDFSYRQNKITENIK